jgi:hypothetical protein
MTATETKPDELGDIDRRIDLENAVCNVRDMAALCLVALEHAGTPESEYVKVTKENWRLLSFALGKQEDFANLLASTFYTEKTVEA